VSWSRVVDTPELAAAALADPGDALDLRAPAALDARWRALGFAELVAGELVRPVPQLLDGVAQTRALGRRLAAGLAAGDLLVLSGPLGAGKTALTQGIGEGLGVQGSVLSPTFVLARVHRGPLPLVHVDAYRLREAGAPGLELDDLDLDADLPASVVVVEWGEGLVEGLADSRLDVRLDRPADAPEDLRTALVVAHGERWATHSR
jgi:tRNA threonylcarbamoyladenosine biosynthesis protein TsaE